jgi:hypothetical protein
MSFVLRQRPGTKRERSARGFSTHRPVRVGSTSQPVVASIFPTFGPKEIERIVHAAVREPKGPRMAVARWAGDGLQ